MHNLIESQLFSTEDCKTTRYFDATEVALWAFQEMENAGIPARMDNFTVDTDSFQYEDETYGVSLRVHLSPVINFDSPFARNENIPNGRFILFEMTTTVSFGGGATDLLTALAALTFYDKLVRLGAVIEAMFRGATIGTVIANTA